MTGFWQDYNDYLASDDWDRLRNSIIEERGYICERCGKTKGIRLHHLNYDRVGSENDDDLMLLCDECHNDAHKDLECF